jgi:hypothetical protein
MERNIRYPVHFYTSGLVAHLNIGVHLFNLSHVRAITDGSCRRTHSDRLEISCQSC